MNKGIKILWLYLEVFNESINPSIEYQWPLTSEKRGMYMLHVAWWKNITPTSEIEFDQSFNYN